MILWWVKSLILSCLKHFLFTTLIYRLLLLIMTLVNKEFKVMFFKNTCTVTFFLSFLISILVTKSIKSSHTGAKLIHQLINLKPVFGLKERTRAPGAQSMWFQYKPPNHRLFALKERSDNQSGLTQVTVMFSVRVLYFNSPLETYWTMSVTPLLCLCVCVGRGSFLLLEWNHLLLTLTLYF